jgi:hypothetical protein
MLLFFFGKTRQNFLSEWRQTNFGEKTTKVSEINFDMKSIDIDSILQ